MLSRIVVSLFVLACVACQHSTDSSGSSARITIRGRLTGPAVAPGTAPALSQATKVVVVYVSGPPEVSDIANGAFSIAVRRGSPAGLIFADASNAAVGYLSLGNGIASLPLAVASDTLTEIDFVTLSASGAVITPAHDPLGAELPLSPADIAALAQTNAYFAEMVMNSDADGDGQVDALSGRFYWLNPIYFFDAGNFNSGATAAMTLPLAFNCARLQLWAFDTNAPGGITFRFPSGGTDQGTTEQTVDGLTVYGSASCLTSAPPGGQYQVTFGTRTLTFTMPDPAFAISHVIVPVPTVTVTAGNLTALDWHYRTPLDPSVVDPAPLLDQPIVVIDGYVNGVVGLLWQSGGNQTAWPASTTQMPISTAPLFSRVTRVAMGYLDSYHTQVVFQFSHVGAP